MTPAILNQIESLRKSLGLAVIEIRADEHGVEAWGHEGDGDEPFPLYSNRQVVPITPTYQETVQADLRRNLPA